MRKPRRRSYGGRKRTYRKKGSRRSLTDRMSTKKRDTMLSAAPTTGPNPSPGSPPIPNQFIAFRSITTNTIADNVHMTMFCPSWRYLQIDNANQVARRTASSTFVKGISETYQITPTDQAAWEWRRIAISVKGRMDLLVDTMSTIGAQFGPTNLTQRFFKDLTGDTTGTYNIIWDKVQQYLFRGIKGTDWADQMTAKLDTTRVNVHSDVMRLISSNNDTSRPRTVKTYIPINKTIVYDDEENGTQMSVSPCSVTSKPGLGDIYIFDLFTCRAPLNDPATQIQIKSSMTYYWHEK